MRLIFIRHGDPDYKLDSLTAKGEVEAELLSKRIESWPPVTCFYTSPLGRAKATAKHTLSKLGRIAIEYDWLKEFYHQTSFPNNWKEKQFRGQDTICWDLSPEFYNSDKKYFNKDEWYNSKFIKNAKNNNIKKEYFRVCNGIDEVLKSYGYTRNKKNYYDVSSPKPNHNWQDIIPRYQLVTDKNLQEENTLVFFCHLGVMFTIISHLVGISPMQLWQGFYVAPSSVTILNSEERNKGQAWFRVERLGDVSHLINAKEKISSSGYFTDVLQE